jgi:Fur family ferric uptake transcriptional regulator
MGPRSQRKLLDQLRARGIRLTSQRAVLVNILEAQDGFVDVATLCAIARRKGARVDRATVYRTLALLRANNLLTPAVDGHAGRDGAAAASPPAWDDLTLVCHQCGTRQPFAADVPDTIKRELHRVTGFDARAVRLEAGGECRLCAAQSRMRSRSKNTIQE